MGLSEQRRRLHARLEEFRHVLEALDLYRPQIRASLYRHRIRCGHSGCHCATGPGHWRWCLSFASRKGRHTRTLTPEEVARLEPGTQAYRTYRATRARAAMLAREIFRLIDRIQKALERRIPEASGGNS